MTEISSLAHEDRKGISDFVMLHVGVSTLCTVKGVGKVERLTTCTCDWNIGWFPSISEINSIPEFGFIQVKLYLLEGSAFNQFEAFFWRPAQARIFHCRSSCSKC